MRLGAEEAFVYLARGLELKRRGMDIISFGIGQPDFQPPEHIIEAAKKAMDEGYNGYGPSTGLPELREAIAEYINERFRIDVKPEEVLITVGAKAAVFIGIISLVRPGDEVILPDPGYPHYDSVVKFVGAKPVYVRLSAENKYKMLPENVEEKISDKTRMIILNYPENPIGTTLEEKEVREILSIAEERGIIVLTDEIYDYFVYEGKHYSSLMYEGWRNILYYVNGFSKTFGMTGWRLGYAITNKSIIPRLGTVANNLYSCPVTFVQIAAITALREGFDWFKPILEEFKVRRNLIYEELRKLPGVKLLKPQGAFYVFPDFSEAIREAGLRDERELADRVLEEKGVVVIPGTAFPHEGGKGHLRFSYAVDKNQITRGINRIREWLENKGV